MASTAYEPLNPWKCSKSIIQTNSDRAETDVCTGYHISALGNMVRNACGCESSILSFLLTGTAAVVNNMAVTVEKL